MKKFVLSKDDITPAEYSIQYEDLLNEAQLEAVLFDKDRRLSWPGQRHW